MMSKSHAWNQMQREAAPRANDNDQLQKLADCNLHAAAGQKGQLDRCCFRNPLISIAMGPELKLCRQVKT
jgi:hypothetical protein